MLLRQKTHRILIIEDDDDLAELASLHLSDEGFEVAIEGNGTRGVERALRGEFDLILVDLMLPGTDGLEICRRVRKDSKYTPLLILTAKNSEADRVLGLEIGADDYLTKPFSFRELVARVKAIFRRVEALQAAAADTDATQILQLGSLAIDRARRSVRIGAKRIELTSREFDLLLYLACHPGRVYTRSQLVEAVWGLGYEGYEHTVNSHINRLRGKINGAGPRQRFIETVWGVGYKFSEEYE